MGRGIVPARVMNPELSPEAIAEFEERSRPLLLARARLGLAVLLVFVVVFSLVDHLFNPARFAPDEIRGLSMLRAVQLLGGLVAMAALRTRTTFHGVAWVTVVFVVLFDAGVAASGLAIHDTILPATVMVATNMITAAFLPWGPWAQLVVASASAIGIGASIAFVETEVSLARYNQLEAFAALGASVWVAASLHRQRLRVFGSERVRDSAVNAQLVEARVAEALARVAREMIEAVDRPELVERMCSVTAEVLECDSAHAFLREAESDVYAAAAAHGEEPENWQLLRLEQFSRADVEEVASSLDGAGATELGEGNALRVELEDVGISRSLFMPLMRGNELAGVLHAGDRRREDPFSEEQRRIARGIAYLASMTIAHARVRRDLEQANQVKAHFVATLSHELRNPITAIQGYNMLLQEGLSGPLNAEQEDIVRRSDRCARELNGLITATLDLSRFDTKRVPVDLETVRVAAFLEEISREIVSPRPESLRLHWRIDQPETTVRTDPLKLKMIVRNLATNAIKFTERGTVGVTIAERDGGIEIRVEDSGIGIAADQLPKLFEPFSQVHGIESRRKGGAGLGLHLVRRLTQVLGGTIDVASEVGRGSTFRVWIPHAAAPTRASP